MKKILLWLFGGSLVLVLGLFIGGTSWIKIQLTPQRIVAEIEKRTKARAQLGSVELSSLLTQPTSLVIRDLKLAPADAECSKPLPLRTPMPERAALISIPQARLELDLGSLASGHAVVPLIDIQNPTVRTEISKEGEDPLLLLLGVVKKFEDTTAQKALPAEPAPPSEAPQQFTVKKLRVNQAQLHVVNRQTKTKTNLQDFQLELSDLSSSSPQPATLILESKLHITGRARLSPESEPVEVNYFKGPLNLNSKLNLVLEANRYQPIIEGTVSLDKDSVLLGYAQLSSLMSKSVSKYVPGVDQLKLGGSLQEACMADFKYQAQRLDLRQTTKLVLPDYELHLEAGSWLNSASKTHELKMKGCVPMALLGPMGALVPEDKKDAKGRFVIPFTREGSLDKPKTKLGL
jgi:hypothetical protein